MRIINQPARSDWSSLLKRPVQVNPGLEDRVAGLLRELRQEGWDAVQRMTRQFDGYDPVPVKISERDFAEAANEVSASLKKAISIAAASIHRFHEAQRKQDESVQVANVIRCWRSWLPIEKVGLYVPGGTAPLISTVLMLAIPAQIAGCREIVLCTPGDRNGRVHPAILYAASFCGIKTLFRLGGVQAIAAMAYGIGEVTAVDKIFGPGNAYVTLAKQQVSLGGVAIDMPAGPSELAILADESAVPEYLAADLLSQAEHGTDSQVLLVTASRFVADRVLEETYSQLEALPRKDIARKALEKSLIILINEPSEQMDLINQYAPEHLILAVADPRQMAGQVKHAGSVFLGNYSPESAGDYASGTNHTLPTSGYARAYSGLSLDSFLKSITYQELTPEGLGSITESVAVLARAEGLEAHARAVTIRTASQGEGTVSRSIPVRENIRSLKPYSSARDEFAGQARIFLDANENPVDTGLNRYPDPHQRELKERVGILKNIDSSRIFLGNGSDEAIDLLIRIFCEPRQSRILIPIPTYGMYSVCAGINDVAVDTVLLNTDYTLSNDRLLEAVRFDTRLIFLCSPNNPTGVQLSLGQISDICDRFGGIVVVDEAYIDFAAGESAIGLLDRFDRLVVLQTFSKAWGLAGVRVGMAFASPEIINLMDRVKYPYNVSVLAQRKVMESVEVTSPGFKPGDEGGEFRERRDWLGRELEKCPGVMEVFPSEANFLLVKVEDPTGLYQRLIREGIVVRDRSSQPLCEGCLRITVGTREQNELLIQTIQKTVNE